MDEEMIRAFLENMITGIESIRDALMLILEQYQVITEERKYDGAVKNITRGGEIKCQEDEE